MKPSELRHVRERLKLPVEPMADLLGVSKRNYYRYESGEVSIPLTVELLLVTLLQSPNILWARVPPENRPESVGT